MLYTCNGSIFEIKTYNIENTKSLRYYLKSLNNVYLAFYNKEYILQSKIKLKMFNFLNVEKLFSNNNIKYINILINGRKTIDEYYFDMENYNTASLILKNFLDGSFKTSVVDSDVNICKEFELSEEYIYGY